MTNYRSLNHSKWACQYHVVFIPKYRKKAIYGELRRYLGEVLRRLARQRESEVEEGHLLADHRNILQESSTETLSVAHCRGKDRRWKPSRILARAYHTRHPRWTQPRRAARRPRRLRTRCVVPTGQGPTRRGSGCIQAGPARRHPAGFPASSPEGAVPGIRPRRQWAGEGAARRAAHGQRPAASASCGDRAVVDGRSPGARLVGEEH